MSTSAGGPLRIHYDVELDGVEREQALPFVIGVIADLSGNEPGNRPPWKDRRFREVNGDRLPDLKAQFGSGGAEATWQGLELLARGVEPGARVKVRVLDASRDELVAMFREFDGDAWDQSPLFGETFERTYGYTGGEPYALLLADYELPETGDGALVAAGLDRIGVANLAPLLRPAEGRPAGEMYSFAAEVARAIREDGWCGGLAKPAWADPAGLDFEGVRGLLCSGPFVHHLKCIVRDKIGNFKRIEDMSMWLNGWLEQYVAGDPAEVSMNRPILDANVRLAPSQKFAGVVRAEIRMCPAFGLGDPRRAVELRTRLPGL